jgi:hypothetical protein
MSREREEDKRKQQLLDLKNAGQDKRELLDFAYEVIADLTDNCAANVRDAGFSDAELLLIFQKASDSHNAITKARAWLEKVDVDRSSQDVFWMVAAQRVDNKIQMSEQILSRLSNTINTRALINRRAVP